MSFSPTRIPTLDVNMNLIGSPNFAVPVRQDESAVRSFHSHDEWNPSVGDFEPAENTGIDTFIPQEHNLVQQEKSKRSGGILVGRNRKKRSATIVHKNDAPPPLQARSNHQSQEEQTHHSTEHQSFKTDASNPLSPLVDESCTWIRELTTMRDDLHMLSVKNAILLDSLTMAGAEV